MAREDNKRTGWQEAICWFFAVGCACAGLTLLIGLAGIFFNQYWRTREQIKIEAHLVSVELKSSSQNSRTVAKFSYEYAGRQYISDKIAVFKQTRRFYEPLLQALQKNETIHVFVDPNHPGFAVIDREFSVWPFCVLVPFATTFTVLGLYLIRILLKDWAARNAHGGPEKSFV